MIYDYPRTSMQDMNLDWIIAKVKELAKDWASKNENWDKWQKDTNEAFSNLKSYVMNYFDNLDVQDEIDKKLDEMIDDGTIMSLFTSTLVPYVMPEWYGAKGDGVTDDSDSFNTALSKGLPVIISNKTYLLTKRINIPSNSTLIFSTNTTIISTYEEASSTDYVSGSFSCIGTERNFVKNVNIYGNGATISRNGSTSYCNCFYFKYCANINVENLILTNYGGKGIMMYYTNKFNIMDITAYDVTSTEAGKGYGVGIDYESYDGNIINIKGKDLRHLVDLANDCHDINIKDCFSNNSPITGHGLNSYRINVDNCFLDNSFIALGNSSFNYDHDWNISKCQFKNNKSNPSINISNKSYRTTITDCIFDNISQAIYIGDTTGSVSFDIEISNCYFENIDNICVTLNDNCYNLILSDSIFKNIYQAISCLKNTDSIIDNVYIINNKSNEAAIYSKGNSITINNVIEKNNSGNGVLCEVGNTNCTVNNSILNGINGIRMYTVPSKLNVNNSNIKGTTYAISSTCESNVSNSDIGISLFEEYGHHILTSNIGSEITVNGDYNIISLNRINTINTQNKEHNILVNNITS